MRRRDDRQRREQYLTSSHTRAHLRRHANGLSHNAHTFIGKFGFACIWLS